MCNLLSKVVSVLEIRISKIYDIEIGDPQTSETEYFSGYFLKEFFFFFFFLSFLNECDKTWYRTSRTNL